MQEIELRTGAWYDDRPIKLTFPNEWDVAAYWPETPRPLTDDEIAARIASPIGQGPLRDLAIGKSRPVIVVDDLSRPTPVYRIMPLLLEELEAAGIERGSVRVLVAAGTHTAEYNEALTNKLGQETFDSCQVLLHDDRKRVKLVGRTSFNTPVYVNPELVDADLIVGVGGVYPQHSTGFGGGGKLALGVLGRKSIKHLHFGHPAVGGNYNIDNDFRRDVTEIAQMIGLRTIYTVHINAHMQIVNIMAGDYTVYYDDAARFSKEMYRAPAPDDADVVIANGYPSDVSYTFMRKANKPILCAPPAATRIMIGSNHGGLGHHGLYPQGRSARRLEYKELWDRVSIMEPKVIAKKIFKNLFARKKKKTTTNEAVQASPPVNSTLWVYTPPGGCIDLPPMNGVKVVDDWNRVLEVIRKDHDKDRIRVRIYPCASLQCILEPTTAASYAGE